MMYDNLPFDNGGNNSNNGNSGGDGSDSSGDGGSNRVQRLLDWAADLSEDQIIHIGAQVHEAMCVLRPDRPHRRSTLQNPGVHRPQ